MLELACEPFATPDDVRCSDCNCQWPDSNSEIQDLIDEASDILVQLSGYGFRGRCPVSVYPCLTGRICPCACGCGRTGGIEIPGVRPVVTEVTLDGVILEDGVDYEVLHGILFRNGGRWPHNANMYGGPILRVTFEHGKTVRTTAKNATVELVCMLYRGGDRPGNELSSRVRQTTIDNVVMVLDDPDPQDTEGVGLKFVRAFLELNRNPTDGAFVWSPDLDPQWSLGATTGAAV